MLPLKRYWIAGAAVLIAGCSGYTARDNPWPAQAIEVDAPDPLPLPNWPGISDDLQLTPQQAEQLLHYADIAEANAQIARELSAAVEALAASHAGLVEAGSAEHELAEIRARQLEEERRARTWDKLLFGTLGLLGVVEAIR